MFFRLDFRRKTEYKFKSISSVLSQFPDKAGPILHEKSKTPAAMPATIALYAMIYSIAVLIGEEPNKIKFKLNYVYDDNSLYMHLYLLKIFANKRLAAMD